MWFLHQAQITNAQAPVLVSTLNGQLTALNLHVAFYQEVDPGALESSGSLEYPGLIGGGSVNVGGY